MNWIGFFTILGVFSLTASVLVAIDYAGSFYRDKGQRNWMLGFFIVATLFLALAVLLGGHP